MKEEGDRDNATAPFIVTRCSWPCYEADAE